MSKLLFNGFEDDASEVVWYHAVNNRKKLTDVISGELNS